MIVTMMILMMMEKISHENLFGVSSAHDDQHTDNNPPGTSTEVTRT